MIKIQDQNDSMAGSEERKIKMVDSNGDSEERIIKKNNIGEEEKLPPYN